MTSRKNASSLSILALAAVALVACSGAPEEQPEDAASTAAAVTAHDKCDDHAECMRAGLEICKWQCIALWPIDGEGRARCNLGCSRNQAEYCGDRYPMTTAEKLACFEKILEKAKSSDAPSSSP